MTNSDGIPVWAYLDREFEPVAWALVRGILVSADCAPLDGQGPAGFVSFMHAGIIMCNNSIRSFNENVVESIRAKAFPHQVSRLRGLYFFASKEDASVAPLLWGNHFRAKNLLEFRLYPAGPVTKVDVNWITYAERDSVGRIDPGDTSWIHAYWRGEACPGRKPAWEVIACGEAVVLDVDVRRQCYEQLKRRFPESEVFLEMAHIAGEVGTKGGLIAPFLERVDADTAELRYMFRNADFHDPATVALMTKHPSAPCLASLMRDNPSYKTPDLRQFFRRFPLRVVE